MLIIKNIFKINFSFPLLLHSSLTLLNCSNRDSNFLSELASTLLTIAFCAKQPVSAVKPEMDFNNFSTFWMTAPSFFANFAR